MNNQLKLKLEAKLVCIKDNTAHIGILIDGELAEETLKIDLNKLKDELSEV